MFQIDAEADLPLAEEFMAAPVGLHSPNLQRLLRAMRGGPVKGKYGLLTTKPGQEWILIQMSGVPDVPPVILRDQVFTDLLDAEREVFRRRWKEQTGESLKL
jgi:hypothetical protein